MTRICLCLLMLWGGLNAIDAQISRSDAFHSRYHLEKVLAVGRHHLRSAVISKAERRITPHQWHQWDVEDGNLTQRGALLEQQMGKFFKMWLTEEGLMDFAHFHSSDSIFLYANSMERTIETARSFADGLMPGVELEVDYNKSIEMGSMDPVFNAVCSSISDVYKNKASAELEYACGEGGLSVAIARLEKDAEVLADVLDMGLSPACMQGDTCNFHFENPRISIRRNVMPMTLGGNLYLAMVAAGNLILQYYDISEEEGRLFGHDVSEEQLYAIGRIKDIWCSLSLGLPTIGFDVCHNLLGVMRQELENPAKKLVYLVGHDSNLSALTGALELKEYTLEGTPECKTPLGGKIVFEIWKDVNGDEYVSVNYVYQNMRQILSLETLDLNNPPMVKPLQLIGLKQNPDGLYALNAFLQRLDNAWAAYDTLDEYQQMDVNLDRRVDMLDAVDIVAAVMGMPFTFFVESVADIDGDGYVTLVDAISLVCHIASQKK